MAEFLHDEWLYDLHHYHYSRALRSLQQKGNVPDLLVSLLQVMVERRELNIQPVMNQQLKTEVLEATGFPLFWHENPEDEQLANYLYDLEAKLRNEQIIDFVRAVSPAIYRIFMRLIQLKIPDITNYIHNSKESSYDRWKFEDLHASDNPILQEFHSESVVNSSSLTELIVQLDLPDRVKVASQQLRELERSVRNPLAHLIKPFDEEELHRSTGFSSQDFLKNLIDLARYTGIHYDQAHFYFDQANAVMEELLKEK